MPSPSVLPTPRAGSGKGWWTPWLLHSLRTSLAAAASFAGARLLRLPEAYWAPISTLVVMQSTVGASWSVSKSRLMGTAIGALLGGAAGSIAPGGIVGLTLGVLVLGLACGALRLDVSAYRFAGVAYAIVELVHSSEPPVVIALHRFIEVSTGIVVALVVSAVWPSPEPART